MMKVSNHKPENFKCFGGLKENAFHSLGHLNTGFRVGGAVWRDGGDTAMHELSMSFRVSFDIKNPATPNSLSVFDAWISSCDHSASHYY